MAFLAPLLDLELSLLLVMMLRIPNTYHQPKSPVVTAPSAATAAAGMEIPAPPSTFGVTNGQSMPMTTNPQTSDGQIKLTTDLLASAMTGLTPPPNWWGYGTPPELTPGTS